MSIATIEDTESRYGLMADRMLVNTASFPGEVTIKRFPPSFGVVIENLSAEISAIAGRMTSASSLEEFQEIKKREFESYVKLSVAIGNVVLSVISEGEDYARLVRESLRALEQKFSVESANYLGREQSQEILFAFSSLKRAFRLLPRLSQFELPEEAREQDNKLARAFGYHILISQLHLISLDYAISRRESVLPEVLQEIIDGARHSVMAYACVRQALELRGFSERRYADAPKDVIWDDEDKYLAEF